jgi:sulfide:quinone oxidoreductase
MVPPMDIVIAGGGVAGLEGLLALHLALRDRARFTLIAPDPEFSYRPLAVAEPFGLGHAHRVPLTRFAEETGAELVIDAVVGVDDDAGEARLAEGGTRAFDALLLAPGGRAVAGVEGATTWWPGGDSETYGGLLRDLEEGYAKRLAIVVPPGSVWPLPAYELALMTGGEARAMGHDDVSITVVTPEHAPLSLFGDEASKAVAEELRWAGIELRTGVVARKDGDGLVLEPSGERLDVQRVFAVPRIVGPAIEGLPFDDEGFIVADDGARVDGCRRTWAAGDGVVSPVKFGGLATHQARRAAAAIARLGGAEADDPGEPVLHGRLLVGHRTRRLAGKDGAAGAPLWWPHGKVAGEHLPRWLAEHGVAPPAAQAPPEEGITVRRPLSAMRGAEAQYLFDLARQFRSSDPAIASLGRRMREMRER